jgi:hypothetical protein
LEESQWKIWACTHLLSRIDTEQWLNIEEDLQAEREVALTVALLV